MKYFVLAIHLLAATLCSAQFVVPQTIPCITITQTSLPALGNYIYATDCIDTDSNLTFQQNENYILKAGEYISFGQNTVIDPDYSHQFHAYIDTSEMEIAWYYPNATPGSVYQFEKLELGVRFQSNIETYVQNFNNEIAGTQINPFDPEELDLKAEFWYYSTTSNTWVEHQQVYGFYYEEYQRNPAGTYPNGQWIKDNANEHRFRIRFAPRLVGLWKCVVSADVPGYGSFEATAFTFECLPAIDNPGFMRVGDNKRYFRRGDEPFFPVGHNLSWPRNHAYGWDVGFHPITKAPVFVNYHDQLDTLKLSGANYFRFINTPWATDIEFEKLGDYSDRMRHAWEMDQIILKAEDLDLLIHWNVEIGSAFCDRGGGSSWWDWTAEGDPNAGTYPCALGAGLDQGYCYHTEIPECVHPIDFLTSATAQKHYKNKLRYLIARYGYSTSIGMIELFSEMNHFGKEFLFEYDSIAGLCDNTVIWQPYTSDPTTVAPLVYAWNEIMTEHIQSMNIYQHPVVAHYAPEPDFDHGDYSYNLTSVDVASWNLYQLNISKYYDDFIQTALWQNSMGVDKPVMHSEFGAFGITGGCDGDTEFKRILCLTPFTGTACNMNWDWQYPGETDLWPQIGIVKDFLEGIKLDEEHWQPGNPIISANKGVEVFYLRNFVTDNYRVVGAVSNRTYNYYTQATGSPCNDNDPLPQELSDNPIYKLPQDFAHPIGTESLVIPYMGDEVEYKVNWYNAFTGASLGTGQNSSDENGNFPLLFPLVSGDETRPILFFEIYRSDEPTFKSSLTDSVISKNEIFPMSVDSFQTTIIATNWEEIDIQITISPNPSSEIVNVNIEGTQNFTWTLHNSLGDQLVNGDVVNRNFMVDITSYSSGFYFLRISDGIKEYVFKIVKS